MSIKRRKVHGISIINQNTPYINYGESRYAYLSWKELVDNLWNISIPMTGPRGGELYVKLNDPRLEKGFGDLILDNEMHCFLKIYKGNSFVEVKDSVVTFLEGNYLTETMSFIKYLPYTYSSIADYKGYQIKFDPTNGFSIWKDNKNIEDNLLSIKNAKNYIKDLK